MLKKLKIIKIRFKMNDLKKFMLIQLLSLSILYYTSIVEMKARRKTKQIEKVLKKAQKKGANNNQ